MSGQNLRSIAIAFVAYNIDFEDRLEWHGFKGKFRWETA